MMYVTREVEITKATVKIFNAETEDIEVMSFEFFDGETEKQMVKAIENMGHKVLKITGTETRKFIGRMTRKFFAENCEYFKDER